MRVTRFLRLTTIVIFVSSLAAVAPAAASEPPPTFISQWGYFQEPAGVAVDPGTGDVYVVGWDDLVRKFTSTGTFITSWAATGLLPGQLEGSKGVAVDGDGNVYVTDRYNDMVRKFTSTGMLLTAWGEGGSEDGEFHGPTGVAVDPGTGDVYVADLGNDRIQKFTSTGDFITAWSNGVRYPEGVAVEPNTGDVFVVEGSWDPHRVWRFTSTGTYVLEWGSIGEGNGEFSGPMGIAVDMTGDVYVADTSNDRIQKFTSAGIFVSKWGTTGGGTGQFDVPEGVAIDASGNVYVADSYNDRIQKFGYRGRPDGRIRRGTGPLVGNNVYNLTGVNQTRTGSAAGGRTVTYYASIQNDAAFADRLRLRGQGSTARFLVVYRNPAGGIITGRIVGGTYTTPALNTGATHQIKITVTVRKTAPSGASVARTLTALSVTHPTKKDTVRFITSRR